MEIAFTTEVGCIVATMPAMWRMVVSENKHISNGIWARREELTSVNFHRARNGLKRQLAAGNE